MDILQVALVSEINSIRTSELTKVSAAVQKQVIRDFAPIWEIQATVDPFASLDDVPLGYWPIIIRDDIEFNAAGIHLDKDGQPFSLVRFDSNWSLTVSHECLEMLGDPFGDKLIAGQSIKPGQGRVEYLVEVCDPPEDIAFSYTVNGVTVSDFYTPRFFEPVAAPGVRYDYRAKIKKPRQVLRGGYISWHDPVSDHWFQQTFFGGAKAVFRDLGVLKKGSESMRELVDRQTRHRYWGPPPTKKYTASAELMASGASANLLAAAAESTGSRATSLRAQIEELKGVKDFAVV